jgi:hypothetical protein
MGAYLQRFDATPVNARWPLVRGWIFNEPLPFFAELRQEMPILVMPEVTLVARFNDCTEILLRHDLFSVALYKPKQGDYWMDEDDTAVRRCWPPREASWTPSAGSRARCRWRWCRTN